MTYDYEIDYEKKVLINQIKSTMQIEKDDFFSILSKEMTIELGESLRNQLAHIFVKLSRFGI